MTDPTPTLALQVWLSPTFPVGAFAYSHGLEWATEAGDIACADDLDAWITDLLAHGAIRGDAVLLAAAWHASTFESAGDVNALAMALTPSAERALETGTQGTAFLAAVAAAWPAPRLARVARQFDATDIAYPVAIGLAASAHSIALRPTLEAFVLAAIGTLVSAVVRLGPIGQSEAQAIIARLTPAAVALAAWAETTTLDDLGTCAWRSDIAAMRHETQYSRLFRS